MVDYNDQLENEKKQLINNVGTFNKSLTEMSTQMRAKTVDYASSIHSAKKIMLEDAGANIKAGTISIQSELNKYSKDVSASNDKVVKAMDSSVEMSTSLNDTMMNLSDATEELKIATEESQTKMGYIASGLSEVTKLSAISLASAAGGAAASAAAGAGKMYAKGIGMMGSGAAKMAAAPLTVPASIYGSYAGNQTAQAREIVGGREEFTDPFKKGLGLAPLLGAFGGPVGLAVESMFFGGDKGGSGGGEGGMFSSIIGGAKQMGAGAFNTAMTNMGSGMESFKQWYGNMPESSKKSGVMNIVTDDKMPLNIAPDQSMKEDTHRIAEALDPADDVKATKQEQRMANIVSRAISESSGARGGIFGSLSSMFGSVFGLKATIGYALPIFGTGYRADLPTLGKGGYQEAILKTLGMTYVHARFASEEVNAILLQQSRMLQLGFELPGTIYSPKPRSLSAWIGGMIGDYLQKGTSSIFKKMFGMDEEETKNKGFFRSLMGKILPFDSSVSNRSIQDDFKKSPSIELRVQLLTDIRDILRDRLIPAEVKDYSDGSVLPSMASGKFSPKRIIKAGLGFMHSGEEVTKAGTTAKADKKDEDGETQPKTGGFFSTMFGGILNFFSGGIFKKLGDGIKGIWDSIIGISKNIKTLVVGDGKEKTGLIGRMKDVMEIIGEKLESIWESLYARSGVFQPLFDTFRVMKMYYGGIAGNKGGLIEVVKNLPQIIRDFLNETGTQIASVFNRDVIDPLTNLPRDIEKKTIPDVLSVIYQRLFPDSVKNAIVGTYDLFKSSVDTIISSAEILIKGGVSVIEAINNYRKFVQDPMKKAWTENEGILSKLVETVKSLPKSLLRSVTGIKNLAIDIYKALKPIPMSLMEIQESKGQIELEAMVQLKEHWRDVRVETVTKVLPEFWGGIYKSYEDRMLEVVTLNEESQLKMIASFKKTGDIYRKKIEELGEETFINKSKATLGVAKFIIKESFQPYLDVPKHLLEDFKRIREELNKYTEKGTGIFGRLRAFFESFYKDLKIFKINLINTSKEISDNVRQVLGFIGIDKYLPTKIGGIFGTFTDTFKSFSEYVEDKLKSTVDYIIEKLTLFTKYMDKLFKDEEPEPVTMAFGGIFRRKKPVVVGEGDSDEAVIPLDDEKTQKRMVGWLTGALKKMGFKKTEEESAIVYHKKVISKLSDIANINANILSKVQNIADFLTKGVAGKAWSMTKTLASLPFRIAKRIGSAIDSTVGNLYRSFKFTVDRMLAGFTTIVSDAFAGLTKVASSGFSLLSDGVKAGFNLTVDAIKTGYRGTIFAIKQSWRVITKPFRVIKNLIVKPFAAIAETIAAWRDRLKAGAKKLWRKVTGQAVVAVDNAGEPVYAKWPTKMISISKQIRDNTSELVNLQASGNTTSEDQLGISRRMVDRLNFMKSWLSKFWKEMILQKLIGAGKYAIESIKNIATGFTGLIGGALGGSGLTAMLKGGAAAGSGAAGGGVAGGALLAMGNLIAAGAAGFMVGKLINMIAGKITGRGADWLADIGDEAIRGDQEDVNRRHKNKMMSMYSKKMSKEAFELLDDNPDLFMKLRRSKSIVFDKKAGLWISISELSSDEKSKSNFETSKGTFGKDRDYNKIAEEEGTAAWIKARKAQGKPIPEHLLKKEEEKKKSKNKATYDSGTKTGSGVIDESALMIGPMSKAKIPTAGDVSEDMAKKHTIANEGIVLSRYVDSLGFPTIGIGHRITGKEKIGNKITKEKALSIFDKDYNIAKNIAKAIPGWNLLNPAQQAALTDMAFNLGEAGLKGFKNTLSAIEAGDYDVAGEEILDSKYSSQVGRRALLNANLMKTGSGEYLNMSEPYFKAHIGGTVVGGEVNTMLKGGEVVLTDTPKGAALFTDTIMDIFKTGIDNIIEGGSEALTNMERLTSHSVESDMIKQRLATSDLLESNTMLANTMKESTSGMVNSVQSFANNVSSNVVNNTIDKPMAEYDPALSDIIQGRLN